MLKITQEPADSEFIEKYQVTILNIFAALEHLDKNGDINMA
jgi:hypothetical protein